MFHQLNKPTENDTIAIIKTNMGEIKIKLFPQFAPKTVENFTTHAKNGYYDGLIFHRVIPGFMIQGGDPLGNGMGGPESSIRGEFKANGFAQNTLKHVKGVLSMARTNDPNSASSQFFIMHQDAAYLDRQYAGFGMVTEGIEVVDKIAAVPTGRMGWYDDVPRTPVVIEKMEII